MSMHYHEARLLVRTLGAERATVIAMFGVLVAVSVLIAVYAVATMADDHPTMARIAYGIGLSRDRSMGEIVAYGLSFSAALMFFFAAVENRSAVLFFMTVLMTFIWFDDAARYHEVVGDILATRLALPAMPGLRPQDTGELLAWTGAGAALAVLLVVALRRQRRGDAGALALLGACFALLLICGVLGDMLHVLLRETQSRLLSILEDGGELVALALITCLAMGLMRHGRAYYASAGQS